MLSTASNDVLVNGNSGSSLPYGLVRSIHWIKPNSANSAAQAIPGSRTGFFPHPTYPSPARATQPKGRGLMPQRTPPLRTSCHRATGSQRSASLLNEPDPLDQPNTDQRSITANAEGQNYCATHAIRVTILRDAHLAPYYQTHVILPSGAGRRRGSHATREPVARGARKEHPLAQSPLAPVTSLPLNTRPQTITKTFVTNTTCAFAPYGVLWNFGLADRLSRTNPNNGRANSQAYANLQ